MLLKNKQVLYTANECINWYKFLYKNLAIYIKIFDSAISVLQFTLGKSAMFAKMNAQGHFKIFFKQKNNRINQNTKPQRNC